MGKTAEFWIDALGLTEHPEGGYYTRSYRCPEQLSREGLPGRFHGNRVMVSSVYYLLKKSQFSALHRLKSYEIWNFYTGAPLTVYALHPDGTLSERTLGSDFESGERFQVVIEPGCWFGATHTGPGDYTLVGCVVAPGFDWEDMEFGDRLKLIDMYPDHRELVERLSKAQQDMATR